MDGGIMKPVFIVKITEDDAKVYEAIPMTKEYNGRIMVKVIGTDFTYYEKIENIAPTKDRAMEILFNKISHLCACYSGIFNKVLTITSEKPL